MPDVGRRQFLTLLLGGAAAACPVAAGAQSPPGCPLVAILNLNSASSVSPRLRGFSQAMHDLGYLEGRDFDLAERYADGQLERLPAIADELVRLNPSLFVAGSMPAAFAAKQASKTIAIVGVGLVDPVGSGLATSEARPGGQVTGTLVSIDGLPGKTVGACYRSSSGCDQVRLASQSRQSRTCGPTTRRRGCSCRPCAESGVCRSPLTQ